MQYIPIKLMLKLLEYHYYDIKDFVRSRLDYMDFMLRVEAKTFRLSNMLITYFTFGPKYKKQQIIDELLELQEYLIDITNDNISRYKVYRFHRAYNHILQYRTTDGKTIEPKIISSCYNIFNAIYENKAMFTDYNYLNAVELGDLLKLERSKCYQALK